MHCFTFNLIKIQLQIHLIQYICLRLGGEQRTDNERKWIISSPYLNTLKISANKKNVPCINFIWHYYTYKVQCEAIQLSHKYDNRRYDINVHTHTHMHTQTHTHTYNTHTHRNASVFSLKNSIKCDLHSSKIEHRVRQMNLFYIYNRPTPFA